MTEPLDDSLPATRWRAASRWAYHHRQALVLSWLVLLWWATFYRLGALRHDRFWTFGFDLGLFDQAIWLISRFKDPFITLRGLDVWGHHGNFVFYLFVPFYWLGAGAKFLLAAQLTSQVAGSIGVYLLCRDIIARSRWIGVVLAGAMLLHPSMQFLSWEYFHPETFAIGPIVLSYWAWRTQRWKLFWAMTILAMSCKEDVALVYLVFGLLVLARKQLRLGGYIAGAAALWYVAVTKVLIPWRNPAGPFYEGHFFSEYGGSVGSVIRTILRHPSRFWGDVTAGSRRAFYLRLWFPVAFVPFIAADTLLLAAPMLLAVVIAGIPFVQDYRYHYVAIPLAVTFVATVEAIRRLRVPWRRNLAVGTIAVTSLISAVSWGVGPGTRNFDKGYWPRTSSEGYFDILFGNLETQGGWAIATAKANAVALVPPNASVSASFNVNPHLAHRDEVYEWPNPWIGTNWGICNIDRLPDPASVQWIVVDRRYVDSDPMLARLLEHLLREEFVVRLDDVDVVAAERVRPPSSPAPVSPATCPG